MFLKGLLLIISFISPVFSWGPIGHSVIASISQDYITSTCYKEISNLIPNGNLSEISSWADEIKKFPEYSWSGSLHFIDTPDWQCSYNYKKDCYNENNIFNFCVDGAIRNYTTLLQTDKEPDYLKFLVHFIGDIHQPLHCGFKKDKGGNTIKVHFNHKQTELHALWDSGLIEYRLQKDFNDNIDLWKKYIKDNYISKGFSNDIPFGDPKDISKDSEKWGDNSAKLACQYSYVNYDGNKIESGDYLDEDYYRNNINIIEKQIAFASINLANLLNFIF